MQQWPTRNRYFWQEAPLLRPLVFLVIGIVAYDQEWLGRDHAWSLLCMLLATGAIAVLLALLRKRTPIGSIVYSLCLGLFFALLGWCAYAAADIRNNKKWFGWQQRNGMSMVMVNDDPQERTATIKYKVDVIGEGNQAAKGQALLYLYRKDSQQVFGRGDTLLVPARWQTIRNSGNPFEFDNASFQRRQGIFYQQFCAPDSVLLYGKANPQQVSFLLSLHQWCDRQLKAYIRDSATLGLMQAMLLGDESGFDDELRSAYSETGVIHIVSISGSHVGVLFMVVTGLLYWIKGRRSKWVKYLAGVAIVWLYVLIAGAPPSALRSATMFTALALGNMSDREGQALNTLCCAAFVLLIAEPAWLFSVGFQLSFGAVLSILLFYTPLYRLWYWPKQMLISRFAWQAVCASIAAEILTAPLVIYYFHNFPLFFIVANLLAAVLVGICALIGGMAVIALCWIPAVARLFGLAVTHLVQAFNACIVHLQDWNAAALQYLQITWGELLLIYALISCLAVLWLRKQKAALPVGLTVACLLCLLLIRDHYTALRQYRLLVYNNGRQAQVDLIHGQYFIPIVGAEANYNAKAAHIGYHTWRKREDSAYYRLFAGKRILVLADSVRHSYDSELPVDVLVIARPLRLLQVGNIIRVFHPKEVVLAVKPYPYHLQRWTDSCAAHGIVLHSVAEQGAYILE